MTTLRVAIVGMPAVGKSTVGRRLSERLGAPFSDLDQAVTERSGRTPAAWIQEDGENAFRRFETTVLSELAEAYGILAVGGGALVDRRNVQLLAGWLVVALDAPDSVLLERSAGGDRPLLGQSTDERALRIQSLRRDRQDCISRAADRTFDTEGMDVDSVAAEIEGAIEQHRSRGPRT